jgi:hypothetical protein
MQQTNRIEWPAGSAELEQVPKLLSVVEPSMDSRTHCAYNQTRECFLGLEVVATELSFASIEERLSERELRSGEGLWLNPFHGIPMMGLISPLDLIYLDEECRVIEAVESYPTFLASPSRPRATSVLVLPAHSIYSSQTQASDQLVLCVADEMEGRLERILERASEQTLDEGAAPKDDSEVVQGAVLLREQPLWSGGPGLLELGTRSQQDHSGMPQAHEMSLIEPGIRAVRPPRNWLERWWSPDPRKAPREQGKGLAAYYWNGAAPAAHTIRDISATGLYVVTEERWYPGTLVLMTLQTTEDGEKTAERSISVMSRAVRWGNDGVGLQFMMPGEDDAQKGPNPQVKGPSKKEFERFLERLLKGKS